jgi:hypothetical protein
MAVNPLHSLAFYSQFVAAMFARPTVERSTVSVWSASPYSGVAEGEVVFRNGFRLRIREEIDFDAARLTSYGYEVYQGQEKLYWYDDFPHPHDPYISFDASTPQACAARYQAQSHSGSGIQF